MKILLLFAFAGSVLAQIPAPSPQGPGSGGGGGGTGTITSVATGCGLTGGTITDAGTLSGTGPCWAAGGGTALAQTATFSPPVVLADGLEVCWKPTAANSGAAPTFAPNGLTAHAIVKAGGALVANDIITTAQACAIYNTTGAQWELQNPQTATPAAPTGAAGGDLSGTYPNPTVAKIDGTSIPVNSAADQSLVTIASATAAWTSLPNCGDAMHSLAYSTSTHTFSCQTITASSAPTFPINAKTATYQVLAADFTSCKVISVASGTFTVTLVASGAQPTNGQCIWVVNYGTGIVKIARSGQNINGGTDPLSLTAGASNAPTGAFIVSNGADYFGTTTGTTPGYVPTPSILGDGSTDDTTALSAYLAVAGGTKVLNAGLTVMVTNATVTADNITLDCNGSTIKQVAATTGILLQDNGHPFKMRNCILDGNSISDTQSTYLLELDNVADFTIENNTFQNSGTPASNHFRGGVNFFKSSGSFANNFVSNVSGYGVQVSGVNSGWRGTGNRISVAYKNCAIFTGQVATVTWVGNTLDHCYDYGAASTGAYGNGTYVTLSTGGTYGPNQISYTEYSGIRIADSSGVNVPGGDYRFTGDWGCYIEFSGGHNNCGNITVTDALGGGISIANSGDQLNLSDTAVGNTISGANGSSTNAGSLTPVYGQGIHGDSAVKISQNTIDGAYYGAVCDNGENGAYIDFGCEIAGNRISDTRLRTIVITSPTGTVAGLQNNVAADIIYVGASVGVATKKGYVVSCIPISSGVTCNTPTSITYRNFGSAEFAVSDTVKDNGPTGTLSASTVASFTGPALYNLTLNSSASFPLFANVQIGTGTTAANGYIGCSTSVTTSTGCPTANHITVIGTANAAGLMVPFPASGTITNTDTSATATISARAAIIEGMKVGVMAAKFDTSATCSIKISDNDISGYSVQPIGGIQDSAGKPDDTIVALGSGSCVSRSPMMGNGPVIASGFGTSSSFVSTPTDTGFQLNVGTGGTATSGVITWGTQYTLNAPSCIAADPSITVPVSAAPTTTNITLSVTGAFGASDIVSVICTGGK